MFGELKSSISSFIIMPVCSEANAAPNLVAYKITNIVDCLVSVVIVNQNNNFDCSIPSKLVHFNGCTVTMPVRLNSITFTDLYCR